MQNQKSIEKQARKLFDSESDVKRFVEALNSRTAKSEEVTFSHTSEVYKLDQSSRICASPLFDLPLSKPVIVDVCASPGGKSILAWKHLQPSLLISNEVIGNRIPALISNIKRCETWPAIITSLDVAHLAEKIGPAADMVIVDAPCSGQSLVGKGKSSMGGFNPTVINANANRQKRIIASAASMVRGGGYLLYCTCTFSCEENEKVVNWFIERFPDFSPQEVPALMNNSSTYIKSPCYRIWPYDDLGAGGFTALFKRNDDSQSISLDIEMFKPVWKSG